MAIIQNWLPPTRENWELILFCWQLTPILYSVQYVTDWYPAGKTSVDSRFNIPGKLAWVTMEVPGFLTVLYLMTHLPQQIGLKEPLAMENWLMAALFTIHYVNRAVISPIFLNPSMSPMHLFVWTSGFSWQILNGICIGGWLAGYGKPTKADWAGQYLYIELGLMIFAAGMVLNIWHDDELREIRRAAQRAQNRRAKEKGESAKSVDKVYMVPENWMFKYILYPHYLAEWIEWTGFWMMCGWDCAPARAFVIHEIATMLPRSLGGKRWYIKRFGAEKIGNRKAVLPGIL